MAYAHNMVEPPLMAGRPRVIPSTLRYKTRNEAQPALSDRHRKQARGIAITSPPAESPGQIWIFGQGRKRK
jgi:hypothetical protein